MKGLVESLNDSFKNINEGNSTKTILYFDNLSAVCIYSGEMEGQITDGKYENTAPSGHDKWVYDAKIEYKRGITPGYKSSYIHKITYNIDDFVKGAYNGDWESVILSYGKVGKVLEKVGISPNKLQGYDFETAVRFMGRYENLEGYPQEKLIGKTVDEIEEIILRTQKYLINDFKNAKSIFLNDKFLRLFDKTEYTINDLRDDLKSMNNTINTYLGEI